MATTNIYVRYIGDDRHSENTEAMQVAIRQVLGGNLFLYRRWSDISRCWYVLVVAQDVTKRSTEMIAAMLRLHYQALKVHANSTLPTCEAESHSAFSKPSWID